jgi:hypothetical protein
MKQTKPKIQKELVDKVILNQYRRNNTTLLQIRANVYQFAEGDDDTVDCIFRILEGYHSAKAEVYELLRKAK